MNATTPDWAKHAVFYQIFPDRFARSERTPHPPELRLKPWGAPPDEQGFQGGDLRGITDRLDYLTELGVTALYLNPIFKSASNHRYHTYDYFAVDPLLGGNEALRELLEATHARDMRVVLDGVFNHAGRGFWPFHHILENGSDSPYLDWFDVKDWPLRPYAPNARTPHNYASWMDQPALPEFNTDNPDVRDFLFEVARHWIDFGIDGWRLDVPQEIGDEAFWQEFRQVVKGAHPDAYICGEIWTKAERWLRGDTFDAVMNYPLVSPVLSFCGGASLRPDYSHTHLSLREIGGAQFLRDLERVLGWYEPQITRAQLNLLDSHDMARARWIMGGDAASESGTSALRLAALCQMTLPGAPCIYYGDEIGMTAAGDPHCRAAFPWGADDENETTWDRDLLGFYRQATRLRHDHVALRTGTFAPLDALDKTAAFYRTHDAEHAVVVLNADREAATLALDLPDGAPARFDQAWPVESEKRVEVRGGTLALHVPAREALVLTAAL